MPSTHPSNAPETRAAPENQPTKIVEQHSRAVRWMHWINFPLLAVMIWSGILVYWANRVYFIGWGDFVLFPFFPAWFYETFNIDHRLAEGMAYHFFFGWLFTINGVLYVLYTVLSGEWRHLLPDRHTFKEAWGVLLHDLHLRKTLPPQGRYNAAQRLTYTGVIVMGAGSVLTGLAMFKPTQLAWLAALFGGYQASRVIHFVLTVLYVLFFVVHIVQVVRAGWGNFWSMVTGYRRRPVPGAGQAPADVAATRETVAPSKQPMP